MKPAAPLNPADRIWITRHARTRLQEHHPNIGVPGSTAMLFRAMPVEPGIVAGLLHRQESAVLDRYFLAEDRLGLFVVAERPDLKDESVTWRVLVTYIRFLPSQVAQVNALWPTVARAA
jgi:hypothetical protein